MANRDHWNKDLEVLESSPNHYLPLALRVRVAGALEHVLPRLSDSETNITREFIGTLMQTTSRNAYMSQSTRNSLSKFLQNHVYPILFSPGFIHTIEKEPITGLIQNLYTDSMDLTIEDVQNLIEDLDGVVGFKIHTSNRVLDLVVAEIVLKVKEGSSDPTLVVTYSVDSKLVEVH